MIRNVTRFSIFGTKLRRSIATVSTATKIGIVGCGSVGNAVGNNLTRNGFSVTCAYDIDPTKANAMPNGTKICSSPKEVAEMADVVITGLPRPPDVRAAAEGSNGILKGLSKDKIWIDHSTTDYKQTLEFDVIANGKGAHILEAPITGGLDALKKGQMVVYIGGEKKIADIVSPLLDASYSEIFYVGRMGSAMIVKVVSNMLAAVNSVAMAEVLILAKRADIDLKTFWNAIRLSAGNSFAWETAAPVVFNGKYDPGFSIGLLCKDLQLGYDMARNFKTPMDLNQLVLSISRRAQYQYGDDAGCYAPPKLYEDSLSEPLQSPHFDDWDYENKIIDGSILVAHKNIK